MLKIIEQNGVLVTDSREVAAMVEKRHSDLLETIGVYEKHLLNGEFRSVDFFIQSAYQDSTGRTLPCYLLTRKGCDMVANKMTGEKGVLFTAAYVTRFEDMEKQLRKPMVLEDVLIASLQSMKELREKQEEQSQDIQQIKAKIENHPEDYYSIVGYANRLGLSLDYTWASHLGREASQLSRERRVHVGKVSDPRFGQVNTYHVNILDAVFDRG
jgi:Rha family phage regulatory protein